MMYKSLNSLLSTLAAADKTDSAQSVDGGDIFGIVLLALLVLFFGWLVIAAVRKKLTSQKGRLGHIEKEEEEEAGRTARLWAEAKRKEEEEEEEEAEEVEAEEPEEEVEDLQAVLLEKAQKRREEIAEIPKSLEDGLKKTRDGFVSKLGRVFGQSALDDEQIEEIEEILFTADIGVKTSQKLITFLQKELSKKEQADPNSLFTALKTKILEMLTVEAKPLDVDSQKPFVILVTGVNGTGKTTTIGKMALKYTKAGKKVILAAADTFRAAAREQLEIWGDRADVQVVSGQEGGDPASVVFDAINTAKAKGADIVIADTAGRLHTKKNLLEELAKVHRVCNKAMEGAPHEVLLVLDATTGQNAINQAKEFHKMLNLTGIILTKLDGTAKGGIIIGISDIFGLPVRFIGIGEQATDLRPFDPEKFIQALFS
jgi:fused signal recognition particle receptor